MHGMEGAFAKAPFIINPQDILAFFYHISIL